MFVVTRYVLREQIGPFLFAFAVITFVLVMDFILEVINLIVAKGLSVWTVLELFVLNLAWMLALSIPMAVLVATLMAFGRLSADNEVLALKANGVSLYKIVLPVILASILLTVGMIFFNNLVLPEANHKARLLMTDIQQKRPTLNIKEGVFLTDIPGYYILIKKVDPKSSDISGITIYEQKDRYFPRTILAERGKIEFSSDRNTLILTLYKGEVHEMDEAQLGQYRRLTFDKQILFFTDIGSQLVRSSSDFRTDREMSASMMKKEVAKIKPEITTQGKRLKELTKKAINEVLSPSSSGSSNLSAAQVVINSFKKQQELLREIQAVHFNLKDAKKRINSIWVEIHKKYSIPVACLVFVLLGAPLGIMAKRGGMVIALSLSLGFFILYWAFLIAGEELADRQIISAFWAMWSANFLMGAAGLFLFIKTYKEAKFISWNWLEKIIPRKFRKYILP